MTSAPAWEFSPVLSDWEQPRIDRVDDLADLLEPGRDRVELPVLTREQLVAAVDDPRLVDAADLQWWNDLEDAQRVDVLEAGQRSLIAAGHLRVTATGGLEASPQLQLVVAVRAAPAFLAFAGEEDPEAMMLRAYGVVPPSGRPGVLVEARVVAGLNRYLLATRAEGAASLARFLLFPPGADDPASVPVAGVGLVVRRRLEVLPPGELSDGRRFEVLATDGECAVAEVDDQGRQQTPVATTHDELAGLIESVWAGER